MVHEIRIRQSLVSAVLCVSHCLKIWYEPANVYEGRDMTTVIYSCMLNL